MFATEHKSENIIHSLDPLSRRLTKYDYEKLVMAFSLGFSGKINLTRTICINYRPGISFSDEYYTFLDFGTSLRIRIVNKVFTSAGILAKLCITPKVGNFSNATPRGESFEYFINVGYEIDDRLTLLLSLNDTINNEYGSSYSRWGIMNDTYIKKNVNWILKIGLEYNL